MTDQEPTEVMYPSPVAPIVYYREIRHVFEPSSWNKLMCVRCVNYASSPLHREPDVETVRITETIAVSDAYLAILFRLPRVDRREIVESILALETLGELE